MTSTTAKLSCENGDLEFLNISCNKFHKIQANSTPLQAKIRTVSESLSEEHNYGTRLESVIFQLLLGEDL